MQNVFKKKKQEKCFNKRAVAYKRVDRNANLTWCNIRASIGSKSPQNSHGSLVVSIDDGDVIHVSSILSSTQESHNQTTVKTEHVH